MKKREKEQIESKITSFKKYIISILLSPYRFIRFLTFVAGIGVMLAILAVSIVSFIFFSSLPEVDKISYSKLQKLSISRVKDSFEVRSRFKRYRWTPLSKVNRQLLYAIVMSEDSTFFKHGGVNYNAIVDSIAKNIKHGEYISGASTITQQVVKNIFLSQTKTMSRKLAEIIIARDLEEKFSKNEILEIYLNIAEFGPDIYGIHMAGKEYFKLSPAKMLAPHGAFLSLMLPSPRKLYLAVYQNRYLSKKRMRHMRRVLSDLLYNEYISPIQYKQYRKFNFLKRMKFKF
jgi:monofunctional biosynthetic peptidoglycan transglycosylase